MAILTAVLLQVKTFVLYHSHYDQELLPKEVQMFFKAAPNAHVNYVAHRTSCFLYKIPCFVYSKWSRAFPDLRSSECTCARKSTCSLPKTIEFFLRSFERSRRDRSTPSRLFSLRLMFDRWKLGSLRDASVTRIGDTLSYSFPQTACFVSRII